MSDGIIILGAGGHAKVIADIVLSRGDKLIGFLDDNISGEVLGCPILGKITDATQYAKNCSFIIGIGNNQTRKMLADTYKLNWYTAIHPTVVIARDVSIGEGTVIMADVVINPSSVIGRHCIINTSTVIEHDNNIGDFVHISPHATLCGTVRVGELTHIGAGATVKNNISICNDCVIGAGAVAVENVIVPGTYAGVPAKKIGEANANGR